MSLCQIYNIPLSQLCSSVQLITSMSEWSFCRTEKVFLCRKGLLYSTLCKFKVVLVADNVCKERGNIEIIYDSIYSINCGANLLI